MAWLAWGRKVDILVGVFLLIIVLYNISSQEPSVKTEFYKVMLDTASVEADKTVKSAMIDQTVADEQLPRENSEDELKRTDASAEKEKIILGYTAWSNGQWSNVLDFKDCRHKCRLTTDKSDLKQADIILLEKGHLKDIPPALPHQYRALVTYESPGFKHNQFNSTFDGKFNITLTYRRGSTITHSLYQKTLARRNRRAPEVDYSVGKTKDMVAYVSNCQSNGYDRIGLMKEISRHGLNLDLFGGCGKPNTNCANHEALQGCDENYKFYLSFENSRCEDYITEKFWKVLWSEQFLIPIAMGGKSMDDYTRIAPPNSFIHVDNFTSIAEVANHLKAVASDSKLFNSYHRWREEYRLLPGNGNRGLPACEFCKIAHEKPCLLSRTDLHTWWNDDACLNTHQFYG